MRSMKPLHFVSVVLIFLGLVGISYMKCRPTSSDIAGPFYHPDSPRRNNICGYKKDKDNKRLPLIVFGRVFACDCKTPLPRVKIELWQANHEGEYKNASECRGFVRTNRYGRYKIFTIHPGKYSTSGEFRPAHLHFRFNGRRGHKTLVTQMYFDKDEHLGHVDPCTSCSSHKNDLVIKTRRVCVLKGEQRRKYCADRAEFNITLAKGKGLHISPLKNEHDNELC